MNRTAVGRPLLRAVVWGMALCLAGALGLPANAAETSLTMKSDSGDYIGGGQEYHYTLADGGFSASGYPDHVFINFATPSYSAWWYLDFAPPSGQTLTVGTYYGATRFPFQQPTEPGLSVSGNGRGCNMLTGSFAVKQIVLGPGGSVVSFWATFEQHCEGAVPAFRGDIRYNADVQVAVTAPLESKVEKGDTLTVPVSATDAGGLPVSLSAPGAPAGSSFVDNGDNTGTFTWTPGFSQAGTYDVVFHGEDGLGYSDNATTRVVVTGITSLLMDSEPGDYIGGGQLQFYTPDDGNFYARRNFANGVSLQFNSSGPYWYLDFAAPFGAMLAPGTYEGAVRFPFQDEDQAGLSISGTGRGCNTLTGRFEVKQVISGAGDRIDAFWATFEQHCEGAPPALRGEIRFNADVPLVVRAPSRVQGSELQALTIPVTALAAEGVAISLTAEDLPPGATFTDNGDNSGTLQWTPAIGQVGSQVVTFIGQDGQGHTERAFTQIQILLRNDDFDAALEITTLPFNDQFDPALATIAPDDPACSYVAPNVWYRITPARDETLEITVSGNYGPGLSVYTGSRGALSSLACVSGDRLRFSALAGQAYHVMVTGSPYGGAMTVNVDALPPPPPNDDIASATVIGSLPFDDTVDTRTASTATTDPSCMGQYATVWYRLTPAQDILIDLETTGSDYTTTVSVYTGTPGALTGILCGLDGAMFNASAGVTYYVMIGSYYGFGGHLALSVAGLPPFTLDLTVDPVGGVDNRNGIATISGHIDCSRPSTAYVFGELRRRLGRAVVIGTFEITLACAGPTPWSAVVSSDTGLFTAGSADVNVGAVAYDLRTGEFLEAEFSGSIRLHGTGPSKAPVVLKPTWEPAIYTR